MDTQKRKENTCTPMRYHHKKFILKKFREERNICRQFLHRNGHLPPSNPLKYCIPSILNGTPQTTHYDIQGYCMNCSHCYYRNAGCLEVIILPVLATDCTDCTDSTDEVARTYLSALLFSQYYLASLHFLSDSWNNNLVIIFTSLTVTIWMISIFSTCQQAHEGSDL